MIVEYEVYSQTLEPYLGALTFATLEEAEAVRCALEKKSGLGWYVREVDVAKRPIPPQADTVTAITVSEARSLMARHGQSAVICLAYSNVQGGTVNIVTAGNNAENSQQALDIASGIAEGLGLKLRDFIEDKRSEHTS